MAVIEKDMYLKIGRPRNTCAACGTVISHAGKHPSVLRVGGNQPNDGTELPLDPNAPHREDYCADCWKKYTERDFMSFWVTKREAPKQRKIESKKERNAGLLAWFEHLQSLPQDLETRQSIYFLAHLLMKYGVFKWQRTETSPEGGEQIFFRQGSAEEEIVVASEELDDERSLEIKKVLDAFLLQYANSQPELKADEEAVGVDAEPKANDE